MSEEIEGFTEEELEYISKLEELYPAKWTDYRFDWYKCKMKQETLTVEFIERFLKWNAEYIPTREAILREWPRRIPRGMVLELCHRAIAQHPDQLMCTAQSFFTWLKANKYLIKHKRYWHNDYSKD